MASTSLRTRLTAILSLSGAMAFGLALACGVWFFLVRLAQAPRGPFPPLPIAGRILINFALFSAFALHHSVLARPGVKRVLHRLVSPAVERAAYVWVASLAFIGLCLWWRPVPGIVWELRGGTQVAGYATQAAGLWFIVQAARVIDVWDLAGVRWLMRRVPTPADAAIVLDRGPYAVVRHPIYLGWVLLTFGTPVMTLGRLSFAFISFVYLIVAIPLEERALVTTLGDDYVTYQGRVRSRLLPGIY